EVSDFTGCKTGQTPLTIKISKQWIDQIIKEDDKKKQERLTEQEKNALINLQESLDSVPISISFNSLMTTVTGLNSIQKNLLESVNLYLKNITQFEEHKLLLKAIVLILKIIEYDLSKKPVPITIGYGFFKQHILSDEERIENHATVQKLLT